MRRRLLLAVLFAAVLLVTVVIVILVRRGSGLDDGGYSPHIHGPSKEAEAALSLFHLPEGMRGSVWAAEPMLANPVSFCFDEKGRCYVAETFRLGHGVPDNRDHPEWVDDDLASRSVEDRIALLHKHLGDKFSEYEFDHDRVRLLEDTKGAGKADKATVFADGFHHAEDGLGAGLLARQGKVYYTCIPDLWLLQDTKGNGKADVKQSLARGFGVHICFFGHDLHGLRMGPDGRLYFSIGDRGFNVTIKVAKSPFDEEKVLSNPDSGAVLRCEPDGSNLEIVATGLRNPQELAFDAYGNLFTVDNNSDSGDRCRLVYIVEGGDSGWRCGYQYGSALGERGPFNAEKIWHLSNSDQPANIVPPLAHLLTGPAGLCFNYGATALPARYKDHFFVCDFQGAASRSGVWSFAVKPRGATFELTDAHEFIKGILATDCDFAPDGGLYVSDWVHGWGLTGKGRIYRFADTEAAQDPVIAETRGLLADGFEGKSVEELVKLLGHADQRVRQGAQFALAEKGQDVLPALKDVLKSGTDRLARLHALWAVGQIGRKTQHPEVWSVVQDCEQYSDAEIRAQAARTLGDAHRGGFWYTLSRMMADPEPRVRLQAALALSRKGEAPILGNEIRLAALRILRENADSDPYLRHAAVMVLSQCIEESRVLLGADDPSPAVRLGVLLALRRQHSAAVARFLNDQLLPWADRPAPTPYSAAVARFLNDPDPRLATEAARAIHDEPISEALPQLAAMLDKPKSPEFLLWRALNAHFRLGKPENAVAVARFAANPEAPLRLRVEAAKMLGAWANPGRRDRVTGLTQDLGQRESQTAAEALRAHLTALLAGPDELLTEAAAAAGGFGMTDVAPQMYDLAADTKRSPGTRVAALRALAAMRDQRLAQATQLALKDAEPRVRAEGRRLLVRSNPSEGVAVLEQALANGTLIEKQSALAALGETKGAEADALLAQELERLLSGDYPAELQLDLLEAAATREGGTVRERLRRFEQNRAKDDPLAEYREALAGGDAAAGERLFRTRTEYSCVRCHKVKGEGGEVGPDLAGIGSRQKREYLLESIVDPNKQIAQGFETVVLSLNNGTVVSGLVKAEDDKQVQVMTADGKLVAVAKAKIDERVRGRSAMPDNLVQSRRDLRDLVEYLASLK
jgi:quinoprotein glucose dehydrogenase